MKCFSVSIVQRSDGTSVVSFEGSTGRSYCTVVRAGCAVLFSSCLIGLARDGLLFDEDGGVCVDAVRVLKFIVTAFWEGE